ncbi:hypothetical protein HDV01_004735, partial [Terramyces sp. JEL0728]
MKWNQIPPGENVFDSFINYFKFAEQETNKESKLLLSSRVVIEYAEYPVSAHFWDLDEGMMCKIDYSPQRISLEAVETILQ